MRIEQGWQPGEIDGLVDTHNFTASRLLFTDETLFRLELQRIFARTWLYVGHESEIPNPGDFVTRKMGNDPVILSRDQKGRIRVLLNSCTHRGTLLCRGDAGNARGFTCAYHGWVFGTDGALVATAEDHTYGDKLDFRTLDLRQARVGTYAGLIFATWNHEGPSLDEHLGDARWYMDMIFARTPKGMMVLGPPHRWTPTNNWKLGPLNFGADGPHAIKVHGPITEATLAGGGARAMLRAALIESPSITAGPYNGIWTQGPAEMPLWMGGDPDLVELYKHTLRPEQVKILERCVAAVGTVFPNFSWVHGPVSFDYANDPMVNFCAIRVWQPVAVNRTEIWNWFIVEQEASEQYRDLVMKSGVRTFTAGGTFDQDDAEAWHGIQRGCEGEISRTLDVSFQVALNYHDRIVRDWAGPGVCYESNYAEVTEFNNLVQWRDWMAGRR
jgi:PAH dioxygenase large subunit